MSGVPASDPSIVPLAGLRGMIARRMMASATSTARVSLTADADATALLGSRLRMRDSGERVSIEDLVLHALASELARHPLLNGTLSQDAIRLSPAVNVGVAVALDGALVVPTLKGIEGKRTAQIARERRDLVARAKAGSLDVADMAGGTFTISNLGAYRVRHFAPLINAPQIAILGLGRIMPQPWVDDSGELCVRPVLGLSLSFDHRALDGEPAAAFMHDLVLRLEAPGSVED